MTLLIRNGQVVPPAGPIAQDVLIESEKIIALYAPGSAPEREETIDATGKYVIPGAIDGHTHMQMPFGGTEASDTFGTGTRAAAHGGTTTIIDVAIRPSDPPPVPHGRTVGTATFRPAETA